MKKLEKTFHPRGIRTFGPEKIVGFDGPKKTHPKNNRIGSGESQNLRETPGSLGTCFFELKHMLVLGSL